MTLLARSPLARHAALQRPDDLFLAMQRDIGRALEEVWGLSPPSLAQAAAVTLRLDVKEDDKAFYVTADLPGLKESDVDVTYEDSLLTIRGEKKIERDETVDTWHFAERTYGSFARQLSLPASIDEAHIEAKFDTKGVLTVTLPKLAGEKAHAKKIAVKSS